MLKTAENEVPTVELPKTYEEAVRFLARPNFVHSTRYRAQQWSAERRGAAEALLKFERRMVKMLAKLGIPAYAKTIVVNDAQQGRLFVLDKTNEKPGESPHNHGRAVEIFHSLREDLPPLAWEVFEHVGKEAAKSLGVSVEWGGAARPEFWVLTDASAD